MVQKLKNLGQMANFKHMERMGQLHKPLARDLNEKDSQQDLKNID